MNEKQIIEHNKKIAFLVYGHSTKMLDVGFGLSLHLVDLSQSETKTLIGASWQKAKDADGNIKKYYCRLCPNWSSNLIDAWELIEYCKRIGFTNWKILNKVLKDRILFGYSPEKTAGIISEAVLYVASLQNS